MFIIDLRNKNVSDYGFSVIDNNNVDEVLIFSHFKQYENNSIYLKVLSDDETYCDKIAIDSENVSVEDDALVIDWTMGGLATHFKQISIQLQFEDSEGNKLAQSRIVTITLHDTIDVSKHLERLYPDVLRRLENEIADIKRRLDEEGK